MSEGDPRFTRAVLLNAFVAAFCARGGDIGTLLRRHHIPEEVLSEPDRLIEASICYAAMEDMAAVLGDPYFCANVARAAAQRGVPMLRNAAAQASSLGDFLTAAILETGRQFDNVAYTLRVTQQSAIFSIQRTRRIKRSTVQVDATGVAFYVTLFRAGLGNVFDLKQVLVSAPSIEAVPPDVISPPALVRSPAAALSVTFPPDWLTARFSLHWPLSEPRGDFSGTADRKRLPLDFVRELVRDNIEDVDFDLERLSMSCATSRRQLQRIFAAHQTSFRAVKDDLRRQQAIDLVTRTNLSLKDVARRTGFSDAAAFSRSYRRWTGEPPSSHRSRTKQGP